MMIGYIDCFAGLAGDMALAAIIDAGCSVEKLVTALKSMTSIAEEWELEVKTVQRSKGNISARHVKVVLRNLPETKIADIGHGHSEHIHGHGNTHGHSHGEHTHEQGAMHTNYTAVNDHHRNLKDVSEIIKSGTLLPEVVKDTSIRVFETLAEAEAKIHSTTIEKVHFHEVGAIDSIIDTVGVVLGFYYLGILNNLYCSSIPLSQGTVKTAHGHLPVPAPACLQLIQGKIPVRSPDVSSMRGELVTPTAASLLRVLVKAENMGRFPSGPWIVDSTGVGGGTRNPPEYANICRLLIGHEKESESLRHEKEVMKIDDQSALDTLTILECNVDDMTGEVAGFVIETLIDLDQVLDAWFTNIQMKKNRPGILLSVLCKPEFRNTVMTILMKETSTIGVRFRNVQRVALHRCIKSIETIYGKVRIKCAYLNGKIVNIAPEYEDCKRYAKSLQVPLKSVIDHTRSAVLSEVEIWDELEY